MNWKKFAEDFEYKELDLSKNKIKNKLQELVVDSVKKNIPNEKFGIMFSGGVDSSTIALTCKKLGKDFTCYTAVLDDKNMEDAQDLIWAKKVAKKHGFKLKIIKVGLKDVEKYIKKIVDVLEEANVIKVGVGLPVYLCCEQAKKDGIKVLFSGLGSEEIFAGYERHKKSDDINKECINGFKILEERDLSRDLPIANFHKIELKTPFLNKGLVEFSLNIPGEYKINKSMNKVILREVAEDLGLNNEFAFRPKKAAQYGSKFDRAIGKLAGKGKKSEYLNSFLPKLCALVSGGKDSIYATYLMKKKGYDIKCLVSMKSENEDSYMFHTLNNKLVKYQAESMSLLLVKFSTKGEKEKELKDLEKILKKIKDIGGVVTGALYSDYQRKRIEKICKKLKLKVFSPLWNKNQEELLNDLIRDEFEVIIIRIAADGLDESWLGKKIDNKMIKDLVRLNEKIGLSICGEGGEYESFVLDGPIFKKKIIIDKADIKMRSENTGDYVIKKVHLG